MSSTSVADRHRAWLSALALGAALLGCDATPSVVTARLAGASQLTFRCVEDSSSAGEGRGAQLTSLPLDRCGCLESSLSTTGERRLTELEREACLSEHPSARLIGHLASGTQGQVATLNLTGSRQIIDLDATIPGVSHLNANGLVSELAMHPYGDLLLLLKGPEGALSLVSDPSALRPELNLDLELGPLSSLEVWPKVNEPLPIGGSPSYAYVIATASEEVLELDLDLLSLILDEALQLGVASPSEPLSLSTLSELGVSLEIEGLITRRWFIERSLNNTQGAEELERVSLGRVAIDARGRYLTLTHALEPSLSVLDLSLSPEEAMSARRELSFASLERCADPYFSRPTSPSCEPLEAWPEGETPACADGLDNDEDGLIDRADPGCEREDDPSEALTPERSSCVDGVDNDRDGAVDLADSDCAPIGDPSLGRVSYGEEGSSEGDVTGGGALPVCLDEIDNDGDGLIDAADPGCFNPTADSDYTFEAQAECGDGLDNDGDGLIDFAADGSGDPDCLFAGAKRESRERASLGSPLLLSTTLELPSGPASFTYVLNPQGELVSVALDELPSRAAMSAKVLKTDGAPLALELRRTGALATLFYVTQGGSLEALQLTAPEPLLTPSGEVVYARGALSASSLPLSGDEVSALYVVRDQVAYELSALKPWLSELSFDERVGTPTLPQAAQEALNALSADELEALEPLELGEAKGEGDLQLTLNAGRYPLSERPWNRLRDASGQAPRALGAPSLTVSSVPTRFNPERHVGLCALPELAQLAPSSPEPTAPACVLAQPELPPLTPLRSALSSYEGVLRRSPIGDEPRPQLLSLSYEGELPSSRSRSGVMVRGDEDTWELADYEASFCELGVEVGDLFVADRFYPYDEAASRDPACEPYLTRRPGEGLYPLRYRVREVRPHSLILEADDRLEYAQQVGPNPASLVPKLATPLAPPPYRCAAQEIAYVIKARADDWLVSTDLGYQHSWERVGGRCVLKGAPRGRARLGERYDDPLLSFTLGYQAQRGGLRGVPEGKLPLMAGARLDLSLSTGLVTRRLSGAGSLPKSLRWLPELDRLYIVDAALQSTMELTGLDPYLGLIEQVQIFE